MRLSFVLSSLKLSGGVLLVIEYANRLVNRGHAVSIVIPKNSSDPAIQSKLDTRISLLESQAGLPTAQNWSALWNLSADLSRRIPHSDVLIATHTPTVVPVFLAALLGRKGRRAWLYMDYEEMFRDRPLERFLLGAAPRGFELIATISEPLSHHVASQTRAPVITTGAGLRLPELFNSSLERPASGSCSRVLYIGSDRPRKGLKEFLAAAELLYPQIPELNLVIVARGPVSVDTGVPHELHVAVSDERLIELYRSSHLFVFPSWGEGLGYPPLEAMASGLPVVLADSQGIRDYAVDGENCLVVPAQDPAALASAMERVLRDRALARRLAEAGPPTARRYNWDVAVDRFEASLEDLLAS